MAFKLIILIAVSSLWFIFGSVFFYRSMWGPDKFMRHTGVLEEIGTTDIQVKTVREVVFFRLQGIKQVFGIYKDNDTNRQKLMTRLKVGDTLTIYYNDYIQMADKPINLYVTHLQDRHYVYLDYKTLNREYFRIGIVLYLIDLVFSVLTLWYYRKYHNRGISYKRFTELDPRYYDLN